MRRCLRLAPTCVEHVLGDQSNGVLAVVVRAVGIVPARYTIGTSPPTCGASIVPNEWRPRPGEPARYVAPREPVG